MQDATVAPRWVGRAFAGLAVEVYGLLVFGAAVRVNQAGLSCPDWPLCFGEVIPPMDLQVFLEWGHRALAGTVSLFFLAFSAAVAWYPALRARAGRWVLAAGGVLLVQIVLGGLTVLHLLADWSVTSHLLAGNLYLAMVVSVALALGTPHRTVTVAPRLRRLALGVVGMFVVQLGLGGLVASNHAGLVCTEWPTCAGGMWFPSFEGVVRLQILHRLGGYTLFVGAWAVVAWAWSTPHVRRWALVLAALVTLQAALGIGNVLLALPQTLAIAHSGMAGLLTLACTFLLWSVVRGSADEPAQVTAMSPAVLGRPELA